MLQQYLSITCCLLTNILPKREKPIFFGSPIILTLLLIWELSSFRGGWRDRKKADQQNKTKKRSFFHLPSLLPFNTYLHILSLSPCIQYTPWIFHFPIFVFLPHFLSPVFVSLSSFPMSLHPWFAVNLKAFFKTSSFLLVSSPVIAELPGNRDRRSNKCHPI